MKKQHFADVYAHLPPSFSTDEDVEKAISMCLHTNKVCFFNSIQNAFFVLYVVTRCGHLRIGGLSLVSI